MAKVAPSQTTRSVSKKAPRVSLKKGNNAQAGQVAVATVQLDEIKGNKDSGEDVAAAKDID
eukprot:5760032-Pleurochrysis_carterae.AAC.1